MTEADRVASVLLLSLSLISSKYSKSKECVTSKKAVALVNSPKRIRKMNVVSSFKDEFAVFLLESMSTV